MRRNLYILALILSIALVATLLLWADTAQTFSIGFSADYRGTEGQGEFFVGTRSYDLYSNHGRVGLVIDVHVWPNYETAADISTDKIPYHPTQFLWNDPAAFVQPDRFTEVLYSRYGLAEYADHDYSTGDDDDTYTYAVNTWIVAAFLAAMLGFTVWRIYRPRQKLKAGFCPTCSYDIRTQLLGQAGLNCPECGTPVNPDSTI